MESDGKRDSESDHAKNYDNFLLQVGLYTIGIYLVITY